MYTFTCPAVIVNVRPVFPDIKYHPDADDLLYYLRSGLFKVRIIKHLFRRIQEDWRLRRHLLLSSMARVSGLPSRIPSGLFTAVGNRLMIGRL